jgi:glyoxylase-like metal-dependent hydrolase (beta-lactamase superfamily II)
MRNSYLILFFILLVANFLVYQAILAPQVLKVTVLEVGKGDATLVRTPSGKTLLIDTGSDASILRALGTALPEWERHIDAIALTSEKAGATGGLPDVMSHYRVPTPIRFGTATVPYGTRLTLDDVYVDILAPDILNISYVATSLNISSTTPKGVYVSDGKIMTKIK